MAESDRLLEIIRVCSEFGVQSFKQGDLEIVFNSWSSSEKSNQGLQSSSEGGALDSKPSMDDLLIENPDLYEDELLRAKSEE